jgi:hypothetical protein
MNKQLELTLQLWLAGLSQAMSYFSHRLPVFKVLTGLVFRTLGNSFVNIDMQCQLTLVHISVRRTEIDMYNLLYWKLESQKTFDYERWTSTICPTGGTVTNQWYPRAKLTFPTARVWKQGQSSLFQHLLSDIYARTLTSHVRLNFSYDH